ncbi:MAG: 16S rRNA (cytosine(1402)-N(4))-methyltransferase RsmH [Bacteroidaceae bacterium]|nr:16S rRNA (cytosine(1402)-N(4))-methyltransferase RsmH [Bacteroidaceae bacterium]
MTNEVYHIPVLLKETVDGLDIKPNGIYVDLTFGGGGHSKEILSRLGKDGHLYSFDQDLDAQKNAIPLEETYGNRFTFVRSNFRFLKNWIQYYGVERVDGILADLGVSSHHLDDGDRGFSFRYEAKLDMRMNQTAKVKASDILKSYSEEQLADVFYLYGELKNSRKLASVIVKARATKEMETTGQLAEVLKPCLAYDREKKDLARVFQALRIEVNGEMTALRQMLASAVEVLSPGGRLSILTYHSLEDRMVKNIIKAGNVEGKIETDLFGQSKSPLKAINRNVITASPEEVQANPRSRSAKLRIGEKWQR